MKRRKFIKTGFLSTLSPLVITTPVSAGIRTRIVEASEDRDFFAALVKANDEQVTDLLKRQQILDDHDQFGGLPDDFGIYTAGGTAMMINSLVVALVSPESQYYQATRLEKPLAIAARFMISVQHNDGTIDLHTTNFHSPPDTGFVLEHICSAYDILKANKPDISPNLLNDLKSFILMGGNALTVGGIHTPNHRWVICRALAQINALFPNPAYTHRIETWLSEHIDIDPDGQYTEKSTAIYSPLTNRCLITIARLLNKKELYDPVRKNLDMTIYYVHPDGEVVTQASRRQDQYQKGSMAPYYYPYRFMALLDNNPRYAAMARWIQETSRQRLSGSL